MCQTICFLNSKTINFAFNKKIQRIMENYYPYSETEMQAFHKKNKFNDLLKSYLWHRSRYNRGLYGKVVTQVDLDSIAFHCEILYQGMLDIDFKKTVLEVPDLNDN